MLRITVVIPRSMPRMERDDPPLFRIPKKRALIKIPSGDPPASRATPKASNPYPGENPS